jgi:transcriptional regulator with XRE-family HTH domain
MMSTDERIGTNVHELLWRRRIRQEAMADAMGVSRSSLAKKMRGEVVWKAQDIEQAARLLKVDPGRLFAEHATLHDSDSPTGQYSHGIRTLALAAAA